MFDKRLYFKQEKVNVGEYAKNDTLKPIYHVAVGKYEDPDCYSSAHQTPWGDPSVREVNPNNCEKKDLAHFFRNLVFCIPLTMY